MKNREKYIDIEKVIAAKNQNLVKWMPGFMLRYIKRIVHEKDINETMARVGDRKGFEFLEGVLIEVLNTNIVLEGLENIPPEGGCIIASNHPLGGLDGMALMYAVGKVRPDIKFLVNDILLNVKNLEQFFIPVNKVGENPRAATRLIEETYAQDIAILVFPAGLVSRKLPEGVEDLEWKKSFVAKALKYKKDIVPAHIDGRNSNWFYNLSNWRRKLGIKANVEMFYLADEMFRQRNQTITIRFGNKIPYESLDRSKTHQQWATEIREKVYALQS
ncbi:MAG: 1-acyl-sn-glycerol-3-phosphate acyltransferase [Owenweeksia sp.]